MAMRVLIWIIWVVEFIAFIALISCATIFMADANNILGVIGVLGGLALFVFAIRLTFNRAVGDDGKIWAGAGLFLIAGFIVFGSCSMALN